MKAIKVKKHLIKYVLGVKGLYFEMISLNKLVKATRVRVLTRLLQRKDFPIEHVCLSGEQLLSDPSMSEKWFVSVAGAMWLSLGLTPDLNLRRSLFKLQSILEAMIVQFATQPQHMVTIKLKKRRKNAQSSRLPTVAPPTPPSVNPNDLLGNYTSFRLAFSSFSVLLLYS